MTQALPSGDAFTEQATHYGAHLSGYINIRPWFTAGDTSTGYAVPVPASYLHSGYSSGPTNLAASKSTTGAATAGDLGCWVWRPYYAQNTRATLQFSLRTILGTPTTDTPRHAAVFGRVQGGTYSETPSLENIYDLTAYVFLFTNTNALGPKFHLLRVNAGAIAYVTGITNPVTATFPNGIVADMTAGMLMSLAIGADGGGNPLITCRATIAGVTTAVFNAVVDSHANKITAAGRWGFGLSKDRQESSGTIKSATVSQSFTILDLNTAFLFLVDEWYRGSSLLAGALINTIDGGIAQGRCLQPAFAGDVLSGTGNRNQRDAGNNRIFVNAGAGVPDAVSSRPSPNVYDHHRSVVFNVSNPSSQTIHWGLMLRGSMEGVGSRFTSGWIFRITHTGSQFDARLYLRGSNGITETLLAEALAVSGISLGANHTLDMEVWNSGPGGQFSGTPTILCKIGAATIPWISQTVALTVDGDDVCRYVGSSPPLSGESEGLYMQAHATGPAVIRADTWTQGALQTPEIEPDDMDGIVPAGESAGATGTFTVPDDWTYEPVHAMEAEEHYYDSGHVNRIARQEEFRRQWKLHADAITDDERDDLVDFFDDHLGTEIPFSISIDDETVTVRFTDDKLGDRLRDYGVHSYEIEVEECLT